MVINMLRDMFTIDLRPNDTFASVLFDAGAGMLDDMEIVVVAPKAVIVEFAPPLSYDADVLYGVVIGVSVKALNVVLTGMVAGEIIATLTTIGVDLLADINVNILAAAMTVFEFAVPVPLADSILCC